MEPAQRRSISLFLAGLAAAIAIIIRLVLWAFTGHLPPLAVLDVPIAAGVTFLVVMRLLDPRTWSYSETSRFKQGVYAFYVTWLVYGAAFGFGLAFPYGLTVGMAYGLLLSLVFVAVFGSIFAVVRRVQDGS